MFNNKNYKIICCFCGNKYTISNIQFHMEHECLNDFDNIDDIPIPDDFVILFEKINRGDFNVAIKENVLKVFNKNSNEIYNLYYKVNRNVKDVKDEKISNKSNLIYDIEIEKSNDIISLEENILEDQNIIKIEDEDIIKNVKNNKYNPDNDIDQDIDEDENYLKSLKQKVMKFNTKRQNKDDNYIKSVKKK